MVSQPVNRSFSSAGLPREAPCSGEGDSHLFILMSVTCVVLYLHHSG